MDCTDIVIGVARGQRFRVFDYYTRDRATPRRDSFYGGSDSITAAVGMEVEGFTNIKWRRRLQSAGETEVLLLLNSCTHADKFQMVVLHQLHLRGPYILAAPRVSCCSS